VLFQMSFVLFVISNWQYPWDLLAICLFTVFNFLVLRRARLRAFVVLYVVAILNSEIACFMAIWLILDPILRFVMGGRGDGSGSRLEWRTAVTGAALLTGDRDGRVGPVLRGHLRVPHSHAAHPVRRHERVAGTCTPGTAPVLVTEP
jgi:hypothetical protein